MSKNITKISNEKECGLLIPPMLVVPEELWRRQLPLKIYILVKHACKIDKGGTKEAIEEDAKGANNLD